MYFVEALHKQILFHTWDKETVFFNELSGETHLFDGLSARIFLVIFNIGRISRSELINQVAMFCNDLSHDQLAEYIDDFMIQCQSLNLVNMSQ